MFNKNIVNKIIRTLILSDFFLFFSVGLLAPIFAVFVLENIDNRIEVIGYAVSCYWVTRVILVMPFSRLMDKLKGEVDEYFFIIIGTLLISLIPIFYALSSRPEHIYLVQVLNGFANAMAVPAWRIIFTRHVDRRIVGFEWSLEDVGVGVATASSAAIGALIVERFGFDTLFGVMSFWGVVSTLILLTLNSKKSILRDLIDGRKDQAPLKIDTFK
ncbi:MAG TPA: MFS transporter [bacterium]|nr:MFS transporter [bacterium]